MTVESYINDANFPYCMEPVLFRKSHDDMEDSMRQVVVVKEVIWQVRTPFISEFVWLRAVRNRSLSLSGSGIV